MTFFTKHCMVSKNTKMLAAWHGAKTIRPSNSTVPPDHSGNFERANSRMIYTHVEGSRWMFLRMQSSGTRSRAVLLWYALSLSRKKSPGIMAPRVKAELSPDVARHANVEMFELRSC